ncbi:cathepsin W [Rattus norvegicus]|uniref:Cathepsin W n=2 Tax=Rattus norvegicus TaxID=10116 RepID=A6HZ64_RAT|nr:cathepsin W precursor [Rattus norvegicus]AAH93401.1 Cathepsin W [Rattus norvegicus]EDM12495.1 cathepsin W [Rattus norvegicus]|eukprot:NP_001019413.1 cathepsin W precursor [Rattus norvegicus]
MTLTAHLFYFLALLLAGQGLSDSLLTKDAGPRPLELKEVFKLFQIQFNRSYSNPAEYTRRLGIFAHNLAQAQRLQEEDLGTAEFGQTPFSDLTEEEFGQLYGHQRAPERILNMAKKVKSERWGESVPPTCDWRKVKNIISSIKNQGNCRCCWAIAAADNIQTLWRIKTQQFVDVSVQELLDCDRCGNGCNGGFVWDAYITVLNNSGLASEEDYPFQGHQKPHRCLADKYRKVAWIQDFTMLSSNEQVIAGYLAIHGPITVTINMKLLQYYQKGVIKATPSTCDPHLVNHSVLLVGFGKEKGGMQTGTLLSHSRKPRRSTPYWILKNSWGAEWGEKGYFRLYRGNNTCGIAKYPITARVDRPVKKAPVSCPP